jgi:thiamine transporter
VKIPTRILTEIIVCVALAGVLYSIPFFQLPNGGRVTLASMVPIFFVALRRGPKVGIVAGVAFGFVALVLDSFAFVVNPVQVTLDYPLAFGALGLAGFFQKSPILGVIVGVAGRFVCHFMSGLVFFAIYAESGLASMGISAPAYAAPVVYSAVYNGSFLILELIMSAAVILVLQKRKILKLYM